MDSRPWLYYTTITIRKYQQHLSAPGGLYFGILKVWYNMACGNDWFPIHDLSNLTWDIWLLVNLLFVGIANQELIPLLLSPSMSGKLQIPLTCHLSLTRWTFQILYTITSDKRLPQCSSLRRCSLIAYKIQLLHLATSFFCNIGKAASPRRNY